MTDIPPTPGEAMRLHEEELTQKGEETRVKVGGLRTDAFLKLGAALIGKMNNQSK